MWSGLSFTVCLLSLLCVGLSLRGVFTHGSKKVSNSSELLFLSAQQLQWEESFSFPIIPEKVLELVSIGLASSCAHLWPNHCGLGDILPDWYWRRGRSPKENLVPPPKVIRNDVGQPKQELSVISLWLNHCWILATSICCDWCWSCLTLQVSTSPSFCHKFGWAEAIHGMQRPQQWSSRAERDSDSIETWLAFWSPRGTCSASLRNGELGQGA